MDRSKIVKISSSPERMTFQRENYLKICKEKNIEPNQDYIETFTESINEHHSKFNDETSKIHNLEYDLLTSQWILEKTRMSDVYAQNLYAALCNNSFVKNDVWPLLQEKTWHCSWRYAGGIIADMQEKGDYIDWYCSGIRDSYDNGFVSEQTVTDEIRKDLLKLGWLVVDE